MTIRHSLLSRRTVLTSLVGLPALPLLHAFAQDATPTTLLPDASPIDALLQTCDSIFGVVIIDPTDHTVYQRNANTPFVSASLYKLVLLTEILRLVETGDLDLNRTMPIQAGFFVEANGADSYFSPQAVGYEAPLDELIYASGAFSSNVAALTLLTLTSINRLNDFAGELGLTGTHYWTQEEDIAGLYPGKDGGQSTEDLSRSVAFAGSYAVGSYINLTTPGDMAWFFRLLRDDDLVSPLTSWRMREVLTAKVITDRIPALLPDTVTVIHKTGNLTGVLHDAGLIQSPAGTVIVVAMAQAVTNLDQTFAVEQRLGLYGYGLLAASTPVASPVASPEAGP